MLLSPAILKSLRQNRFQTDVEDRLRQNLPEFCWVLMQQIPTHDLMGVSLYTYGTAREAFEQLLRQARLQADRLRGFVIVKMRVRLERINLFRTEREFGALVCTREDVVEYYEGERLCRSALRDPRAPDGWIVDVRFRHEDPAEGLVTGQYATSLEWGQGRFRRIG